MLIQADYISGMYILYMCTLQRYNSSGLIKVIMQGKLIAVAYTLRTY